MFKYFQKAFRKILKKIYIKYIILLSSFKEKPYLNKVIIHYPEILELVKK